MTANNDKAGYHTYRSRSTCMANISPAWLSPINHYFLNIRYGHLYLPTMHYISSITKAKGNVSDDIIISWKFDLFFYISNNLELIIGQIYDMYRTSWLNSSRPYQTYRHDLVLLTHTSIRQWITCFHHAVPNDLMSQ